MPYLILRFHRFHIHIAVECISWDHDACKWIQFNFIKGFYIPWQTMRTNDGFNPHLRPFILGWHTHTQTHGNVVAFDYINAGSSFASFNYYLISIELVFLLWRALASPRCLSLLNYFHCKSMSNDVISCRSLLSSLFEIGSLQFHAFISFLLKTGQLHLCNDLMAEVVGMRSGTVKWS